MNIGCKDGTKFFKEIVDYNTLHQFARYSCSCQNEIRTEGFCPVIKLSFILTFSVLQFSRKNTTTGIRYKLFYTLRQPYSPVSSKYMDLPVQDRNLSLCILCAMHSGSSEYHCQLFITYPASIQ